jgi:hypothetical protein
LPSDQNVGTFYLQPRPLPAKSHHGPFAPEVGGKLRTSDESGCRGRHGMTQKMAEALMQCPDSPGLHAQAASLREVMCWQWSLGQIQWRARKEREGCLAAWPPEARPVSTRSQLVVGVRFPYPQQGGNARERVARRVCMPDRSTPTSSGDTSLGAHGNFSGGVL